jgi:DNA-binding response OmpR family regulator
MKILVVEDDKLMAEVLQTSLEEENYSVSVAFDGNAGLDLTETYRFDLIVLDPYFDCSPAGWSPHGGIA